MADPLRFYGLPLAEWRGAYRAIGRSNYYLMFVDARPHTRSKIRHARLCMVCCLLLPLAWHRDHQGRLSPTYKRDMVWHEGTPRNVGRGRRPYRRHER